MWRNNEHVQLFINIVNENKYVSTLNNNGKKQIQMNVKHVQILITI